MKRFISVLLAALMLFMLAACGDVESVQLGNVNQEGEPRRLSFIAEFFDNSGERWLQTEGSVFNISPNKVKEYSYDSDGSWISQWTMSSVMTIDIDGNQINSCGSTVIIYDSYLSKYDCVLPADAATTQAQEGGTITSPGEYDILEYWTLGWWWELHSGLPQSKGSKIVMVQSQNGDPICLFTGNEVTWEVSRNLPKTTEITIDGAKLYIHRANFAIIDTSLFDKEG